MMEKSRISVKPKMIKRDVLRHWPLWTMSLIVYIFVVFLINSFARNFKSTVAEYEISMTIVQTMIELTKWVSFFMGIVSGWAAFGFLGNKKKDHFYETLPFNRLTLFVNRFLFGFIMCIIPCVAIFFIELLQILFMAGSFEIVMLVKWFASAFIEHLFWFSFAVLFMVVCGRTLMAGFCYLFFSLVGLILNGFLQVANMICYIGVTKGMGDGSSILGILSPVEYIGRISANYIPNTNMNDPDALFAAGSAEKLTVVLIAGVLIVILTYLIFTIRKEEHTGDTIVFNGMKIAFCSACSFIGTVIFACSIYMMVFYENDSIAHRIRERIILICLVFISGFIEYFICCMIVEKKFKIFKKNALKAFVFAAVISLVITGYMHDLFNIEGYVPKTEDVEYVSVNDYNEALISSAFGLTEDSPRKSYSFHDKDGIEMITEIHREIVKKLEDTGDFEFKDNARNYYNLYFSYILNNQAIVTRKYSILKGSETDKNIRAILERRDFS